jgi:hypothetical protein
MGWFIAGGLGAMIFVALWRSGRCSQLALELAAAAILIGLAGYSWQGRPDLAGHAVTAALH